MKLIIALLTILSGNCVWAYGLPVPPTSDCYFRGQELHRDCPQCGWYAIHGDKNNFYVPVIEEPKGHFEYSEPSRGLKAVVDLDRINNRALFMFETPHISKTETAELQPRNKTDSEILIGSTYADTKKPNIQHAFQTMISCDFGLGEKVAKYEAKQNAEMDRLGPPREWPDPSAPSMENLPLGTVLELIRDLVVTTRMAKYTNFLVEKNGLLSHAEFWSLHLPFRFSFVELYNAKNSIEETQYPKGMKLKVKKVSPNELIGAREYVVDVDTMYWPPTHGKRPDPITWIKVTGRRSGVYDIKIPQFVDTISSYFKVSETK